MTTLKSIIRPVNASYKSSAREIEGRFKEKAKHCRQKLDQYIAAHDGAAIIAYNEYIHLLLSVHESCSEVLDWDSFTSEQEPISPVFWPLWENEAQFGLMKYEPTFLDIITGKDRRKIRSLREKLVEARAEDIEVHLFNQKNYFKNKDDWERIQLIKNGIKHSDPAAYKAAIDFFDPYAKITHLGSSLVYDLHNDHVSMDVYIDGAAIIPGYSLTQTGSGNLIIDQLALERFNEIYYDYICSCALFLARETFALLPVRYVYVNVMQNLLNALDDGTKNNAVLCVKFNPDVLEQENEEALECLKVLINIPGNSPFSHINNFSAHTKLINEGDVYHQADH